MPESFRELHVSMCALSRAFWPLMTLGFRLEIIASSGFRVGMKQVLDNDEGFVMCVKELYFTWRPEP